MVIFLIVSKAPLARFKFQQAGPVEQSSALWLSENLLSGLVKTDSFLVCGFLLIPI